MNGSPLISVVIPTFNRRHTLPRCLDSVFAQTFSNFEILLVDDGSQDGTAEWVRSLTDPRLHYLPQAANQGVVHVTNLGIDAARGEFIALLDSDDCWLPEKLEKQIACLQQLSHRHAMVYHQMLADDGVLREARPFRGIHPGERVGDYLFRHNGLIQTNSLFASRKIFQEYRADSSFRTKIDWDLCLQWEKAGVEFHFLPEPLAIWHCEKRSDRLSHLANRVNENRAWIQARTDLVSPKARQAFLAELVAPGLHRNRQTREALFLVLSALKNGAISLKTTLRLLLLIFLPEKMYDAARKIPPLFRQRIRT